MNEKKEREILEKTIRDAQRVIDKAKKELSEQVYYSIGDRFVSAGYIKAILAQVGFGEVCMVRLSNGNRDSDPVHVESVTSITEQEFDKITRGTKYNRYWDAKNLIKTKGVK